ncbi:MAG: hypothetical protein ACREJO_01125, partial [Phycisphaerales bacterium]
NKDGKSHLGVQYQQRQQQGATGRDVKSNASERETAHRDQQAQVPGREAAGNQKAEGKLQPSQSQRSGDSARDKPRRGSETPTRGNPTNASDGNDEDSTIESGAEIANEEQAVGKTLPRGDAQGRDKDDDGCGCTGNPDQPR